MDSNTISRFLSYVEPIEPCWLWIGAQAGKRAKFGDGYGTFWDGRDKIRAHRFSFLAFKGEIPEGLLVLHVCHNKPCVRPDHLRLGTHRENMAESVAFGGHGAASKNAVNSCRLTESQLTELSERYEQGESSKALALEFGLAPSTAWRYCTGTRG